MKRCPKCYELYADAVQFCELDGQPLLVDVAISHVPGQVLETEVPAPEASAQKRETRLIGVMGVMIGVLLTSLAYTGYALLTAEPSENDEPISKVAPTETRAVTHAPRTAVLEPSPSPEEEASPSPEEVAEAEASPAADAEELSARLNTGPVSTGQRREEKGERVGDKTIIQMNDGTSVEVDAAWSDRQGIWYRRGGLVSFVDSNRVKGIRTREEPKPAAVSSPTP